MSMDRVYRLIRLNRHIKSHRVKFAGILLLQILGRRNLFLRFDPVVACNLRCQMCYFSDKDYRKENKGIFREQDVARLAKMFFPRTMQVVFGCGAEPTLYKNYPELVQLAKSYGVPQVGMVSNGQLFTEDVIRRLVGYGLDELMLSVHGVTKQSYERFMTGASFDKLHEVLRTLQAVKAETGNPDPALRINYTVNPDNLDELEQFFDVFGQYDIHTLQVRPIMDIGQGVYRNFELDRHTERYNAVIERLSEQCKDRGVSFLARRSDPGYQGEAQDYGSMALASVLRFVSPQRVWRHDFDWRNEDYDAFCKRIGFSRSLLRAVFASRREMAKKNPFKGTLTLSYDVL